MEIIKKESKSGKVFRIYKEVSAWDMYVIEWLTVGKCEDGSDYRFWSPAYEPKNKIFTDLNEAYTAFNAFLQS